MSKILPKTSKLVKIAKLAENVIRILKHNLIKTFSYLKMRQFKVKVSGCMQHAIVYTN